MPLGAQQPHVLVGAHQPGAPVSYAAGPVELRSLSAPVFAVDGRVAFTLTLWGPPGAIEPDEVERHVEELLAATVAATESIGGRLPREDAAAIA